MAEDERQERMIARQIERAQKSLAKPNDDDVAEGESESGSEEEYSGSDDDGEEQEDDSKEANKATGKIAIALQKAVPGPKVNPFEDKTKVKFGFDEEDDSGIREKEKDEVATKKGKDVKAAEARRSALDELMKEEEKARRGAIERTTGCTLGLWSR
jgi:DNA/RNA-binding protein KIN17